MLSKVLWAFGFISIAFVTQCGGLKQGEFGVCEHVITKTQIDRNQSPPRHEKKNITVLECCPGFFTVKDTCYPECNKACVNSKCIGGNKCQCNPGYYRVDDFRCLAICDPPCSTDMACLAPNKCFCKNGYNQVNESYCEPTCSFNMGNGETFDCINARCIAPDMCECHEGYTRVSEFQCEPTCSNCENGDCVAPEHCECKDGYEMKDDGHCTPVCDPKCVNGDCVGPNQCKCHENFEKYLKAHECLEKQVIKDRQSCEKSCQHGTCDDDGTCECDDDYEMFNGKCLRKCDENCENGKCLEDQCICFEGYKLSENSTGCVPICAFENGHDCIGGVCIAPQICQCFEGYKFLDYRNCTCIPSCDPACINGVCSEEGCICHENFFMVENSTYECARTSTVDFDDSWLTPLYDSSETTTDDYFIFDSDTTTETDTSSYEDTTERDGAKSNSEEDSETDDDDEDDDEGSTSTVFEVTERVEEVITEKTLQQMIPVTLLIILLSIITILIISILTTFCFLYKRMNAKNIYYVNEQEKSPNCVYFTRQNDSVLKTTDVECSL